MSSRSAIDWKFVRDRFVRNLARIRDFAFVVMVVAICTVFADWKRRDERALYWLSEDQSFHLGAENDSIARAIRSGRGFSDPFMERTGPTAWMPPAMPFTLSLLYWYHEDNRREVVDSVLRIQAFAVILTGFVVILEARRLNLILIGYLIFPMILLVNFHQFFQCTHDIGILLITLVLLWVGVTKAKLSLRSSVPFVLWGALGGIGSLCSPIIFVVWSINSLVLFVIFTVATPKKSILLVARAMIIALLSCAFVVTPWLVRNAKVFGRFIPIKSNAGYELWQSQCADDDGVLDSRTLATHPWQSKVPKRDLYKQVGEMKFIDEHLPEAWNSISSNPREFIKRFLRRAFVALILYRPLYKSDEERIWPMLFTRMVFPLPFLGCVSILAFASHYITREELFTIGIYLGFLSPYIVISYYDRYSSPLLLVKMLLVLYLVVKLRLICNLLKNLNVLPKKKHPAFDLDRKCRIAILPTRS